MEDRRSAFRCEVCGGPTKIKDGKKRCRNSMCAFNHQDISCPRCQTIGPDVNGISDGKCDYSCKECLHRWSQ